MRIIAILLFVIVIISQIACDDYDVKKEFCRDPACAEACGDYGKYLDYSCKIRCCQDLD